MEIVRVETAVMAISRDEIFKRFSGTCWSTRWASTRRRLRRRRRSAATSGAECFDLPRHRFRLEKAFTTDQRTSHRSGRNELFPRTSSTTPTTSSDGRSTPGGMAELKEAHAST
jgi:hypothetical protein